MPPTSYAIEVEHKEDDTFGGSYGPYDDLLVVVQVMERMEQDFNKSRISVWVTVWRKMDMEEIIDG